MTTSSRPGASTEGAPLLATRSGDETGDAPRRRIARFTPTHAVACAVAALGFLCVVAGDRLAGGFFVAGARSSTTARLSRTSRLNAPALSSEFVDRLNARPGRSWSARVPKGMESATHADLARLSGGRLSAAPIECHHCRNEKRPWTKICRGRNFAFPPRRSRWRLTRARAPERPSAEVLLVPLARAVGVICMRRQRRQPPY